MDLRAALGYPATGRHRKASRGVPDESAGWNKKQTRSLILVP